MNILSNNLIYLFVDGLSMVLIFIMQKCQCFHYDDHKKMVVVVLFFKALQWFRVCVILFKDILITWELQS